MAEIRLQRPGIVALVGQGEATGVPQHVRMNLDAKPGSLRSALQQPGKARWGEGRTALAGEYERRLGILLPLQPAQRPHLVADDGMRRRRAPLGPADVCGELFTMSVQKLVALIRSHILEAWLRPAPFAPVPLNQIGKIFCRWGGFIYILRAYRLRL